MYNVEILCTGSSPGSVCLFSTLTGRECRRLAWPELQDGPVKWDGDGDAMGAIKGL